MAQKRQRNGGMAITGMLLFGASLFAIWIMLDSFNNAEIFTIIPGIIAIGAAAMCIVGANKDIERFKASGNTSSRLPSNGLLNIGGVALGLGLAGLLLMALYDLWDDTILLVFEVISVTFGAGALILGVQQDKKLAQEVVSTAPSPTAEPKEPQK